MRIQKIFYFPIDSTPEEFRYWLEHSLVSEKEELFGKWKDLPVEFFPERTPSRDRSEEAAYLVRADVPDEVFSSLLPGFSEADARFVFIGSLLEHGWETVPREEDVAFLYGEYVDGDLQSMLKFDGEIRRYTMRSQLMPNINRRFTRFVVLFPDIISYIQEANSNFPRQCYVVSQVVTRVAGKMDDVETLATLNGVRLERMEDYISLMEKIAGKEVVLSHGRFRMEPVSWPILLE